MVIRAATVLLLWALAAQMGQFRTTSDVVPVYATVTGQDGRTVPNLTAKAFRLAVDGKSQPISLFSADRRPLAVAVLIDSTGSMIFGAGMVRAAGFARAVVEALDATDAVAVGSLTRPIAPLRTEKSETRRLLENSALGLGHDFIQFESTGERGMSWALSVLESYAGRRVVVFLTDGRFPAATTADRTDANGFRLSNQTAEDFVARAQAADVTIHTVAFDDTMVEENFLTAFARTGGASSLVSREADLRQTAADFVQELHQEYLLGFVPTQFDGKSHKVEVTVVQSGVRVRARRAFVAGKR